MRTSFFSVLPVDVHTGGVTMFPAAEAGVAVGASLSKPLNDIVSNLLGNFIADIFDTRFRQLRSGHADLVDHIVDGSDDARIGDGVMQITAITRAAWWKIHQHSRAEGSRISDTSKLTAFQSVDDD